MDNPITLLVAIMFVTLVVTGLVSILMCLSNLVAGNSKTDHLQTSWIVLLLIACLHFFWQTSLILEVEGWEFLSFAGFIIGPVALLFATNLLIVTPEGDEQTMLDTYSGQICHVSTLVDQVLNFRCRSNSDNTAIPNRNGFRP